MAEKYETNYREDGLSYEEGRQHFISEKQPKSRPPNQRRPQPSKPNYAKKKKNYEVFKRKLTDFHLWQRGIAEKIDHKIRNENLRPVKEDEECNLYITFFIDSEDHQGDKYPDVDNLLKGLFDALKKPDGKLLEAWSKAKGAKGQEKVKEEIKKMNEWKSLIFDDREIRDFQVSREIDIQGDRGIKKGVDIQYVITKTFEIERVEKVPGEKFMGYWAYSMNWITAYEMKKVGKNKYERKNDEPYKFIDNVPGNLFLVMNEKAENITLAETRLIPPGYDWKKTREILIEKGKRPVIEGCMVFKKRPQEEETEGKRNKEHWYLVKKSWPKDYDG